MYHEVGDRTAPLAYRFSSVQALCRLLIGHAGGGAPPNRHPRLVDRSLVAAVPFQSDGAATRVSKRLVDIRKHGRSTELMSAARMGAKRKVVKGGDRLQHGVRAPAGLGLMLTRFRGSSEKLVSANEGAVA